MYFRLRWVIEAVNGLIKNWKIFKNTLSNNHIPVIGDYIRIVCALCNAFRPSRVLDTSSDSLKAERMLQKLSEINFLETEIKERNLINKRVCWKVVNPESIQDFPKYNKKDLRFITFGVYQV